MGEIVALRAAGGSLRAISRALAARGILARNGRPLTPKVLLGLARYDASQPVTNRSVGNVEGVV